MLPIINDQKVMVTASYLSRILLLTMAWPTVPTVARRKNRLPIMATLKPFSMMGWPTMMRTPKRLTSSPTKTLGWVFSFSIKIEKI